MMSKRSLIGVDVGGRAIRAVQMDRSGSRIVAALKLPREEGAGAVTVEEAAKLDSVLFRQGFEGASIALCVPDSKLMTAVLELPPRSSGAPLDQLARVEVARVHKKDPGSFEMACWDVPAPGRGAAGTHLMAAACPHDVANGYLDAFEGAGFRVAVLDAKPWALARACATGDRKSGVVLEIGEEAALLVVIRDSVPVYERTMKHSGMNTVRARIREDLGVTDEVVGFIMDSLGVCMADDADEGRDRAMKLVEEHVDALCIEVRAAMDYVSHRYSGDVGVLMVAGDGGSVPGVAQRMSAGTGLEVSVASPVGLAECPSEAVWKSDAGMAAALGLARRAA